MRLFRRRFEKVLARRRITCACGVTFLSPALPSSAWRGELIFTCPNGHTRLYGTVRIAGQEPGDTA